jgi:diguanylate cyclase (GGDEF)-like protein
MDTGRRFFSGGNFCDSMKNFGSRIRCYLSQRKTGDLQRKLQEQNARLQDEIAERVNAEEALTRQTEELLMLYNLNLAVTSGLEFNHILKTLYLQLMELMPVDVFYVALYDIKADLLELPVYFERNANGKLEPDKNIPTIRESPAGFSGYVIRTRQMFHVADIFNPTTELPARPIHIGGPISRSYVGIPLIWQGQVTGLLSVQSYLPNAYTPEHIRLLQSIAAQAAIAIQNVHLYETAQSAQKAAENANRELQDALFELERLATIDKLTGAFNRRKFDDILKVEIKRALRYNTPLSLVMFDIDHFKNVNDTYGHHVGDQVLVDMAQIVINTIRITDTLTRWGGEEFIVLSPGCNLAQSVEMAERLRQVISSANFPLSGHITISLGVSEFCPEDTPDRLILRADDALYRAKNNGRNCVALSPVI